MSACIIFDFWSAFFFLNILMFMTSDRIDVKKQGQCKHNKDNERGVTWLTCLSLWQHHVQTHLNRPLDKETYSRNEIRINWVSICCIDHILQSHVSVGFPPCRSRWDTEDSRRRGCSFCHNHKTNRKALNSEHFHHDWIHFHEILIRLDYTLFIRPLEIRLWHWRQPEVLQR